MTDAAWNTKPVPSDVAMQAQDAEMIWRCDDCGARWGPVSAPRHCPECGEAGRQDDACMALALAFLNAHFKPWEFHGREPVSEALAALLRAQQQATQQQNGAGA